MYKVIFDCTVLTPMFIAGADQGFAELRAASIKGAMRYWYRALLGRAGYQSLDALSEQESAVFGSTKKASSVSVRVSPLRSRESHKAERLLKNKRDSGIGYLWYSTQLGANNRSYFDSGSKFQVTLSSPNKREAVQHGAAAFWLAANCGGLGTRSRRCAGSFAASVKHASEGVSLPYFHRPGSESTYFATFFEHIDTLLPAVGVAEQQPDYDSFGAADIYYYALGEKTGLDAAEEMGKAFKDYRYMMGSADNDPLGSGEDYATLSEYLRSGRVPRTVTRASFGLPLKFVFKRQNRRQSVSVQPHPSREYKRRSSPLWLRVSKAENGTYGVVLTHFKSKFLPSNKIQIQKNRRDRDRINAPQNSLVPPFIATLSPIESVYSS